MKGCRKIVVAVNGSHRDLGKSLKAAGEEGGWITVVKVVPPYKGDLDLTGIRSIRDVIESGGGQAAEEIRGMAREERLLVKVRLDEGEFDEKVAEIAREERGDLIVVQDRPRTWWERLFGGSLVEKLIRRAPCPVLVLAA